LNLFAFWNLRYPAMIPSEYSLPELRRPNLISHPLSKRK
jgi:hypothetical protein